MRLASAALIRNRIQYPGRTGVSRYEERCRRMLLTMGYVFSSTSYYVHTTQMNCAKKNNFILVLVNTYCYNCSLWKTRDVPKWDFFCFGWSFRASLCKTHGQSNIIFASCCKMSHNVYEGSEITIMQKFSRNIAIPNFQKFLWSCIT